MTRKEQAMLLMQQINDTLRTVAPSLRESIDQLRDVVGEGQNGPPDRKADGSIDDETWTQLRDAVRDVDRALASLVASFPVLS